MRHDIAGLGRGWWVAALSLSLSNRVCPPSVRSCTAADPSLYFWLRHQGWPGQAINALAIRDWEFGMRSFLAWLPWIPPDDINFLFEMAQVNCGNTLQQRNNIAWYCEYPQVCKHRCSMFIYKQYLFIDLVLITMINAWFLLDPLHNEPTYMYITYITHHLLLT